MASRHQVTCIVPDGADADQRIDAVGGTTGGTNTNGPWQLLIDAVIAGIENGTYQFWTYAEGRAADVIVAKHRNGPTKDLVLAFQGHYSRFANMARDNF